MRIPQRLRREDGAAAVEFALIVGVLAMLIFGMLQFGLTFFELQNLRARLGKAAGSARSPRRRMRSDPGSLSASDGAISQAEAPHPFVTVQYSDDGTSGWTTKSGNTTPACSSAAATSRTLPFGRRS